MGDANSRMGAPGDWNKSNTPFAWNPKTAITFCDAVNLIDVYLDPSVPISREMVALFFFHESGFSIIDQAGGGPGFGFAQVELKNQPAFTKAEFGTTDANKIRAAVLDDVRLAVKLHCDLFKFFFVRQTGIEAAKALQAHRAPNPIGETSLVGGQVGASSDNSVLIARFKHSAPLLKSVIYSSNRMSVINSLNDCRWYLKRDGAGKVVHDGKGTPQQEWKPIPYPRYKDYWDFTLPERDLMFGIRK